MGVNMVVVSGCIGANNNGGGIESDCWWEFREMAYRLLM